LLSKQMNSFEYYGKTFKRGDFTFYNWNGENSPIPNIIWIVVGERLVFQVSRREPNGELHYFAEEYTQKLDPFLTITGNMGPYNTVVSIDTIRKYYPTFQIPDWCFKYINPQFSKKRRIEGRLP
jgi:hypothetical protein